MLAYTVSFLHQDGAEHTSRHFSTIRAARKWADWLASCSYVARVQVWRGHVGENLVEERGR